MTQPLDGDAFPTVRPAAVRMRASDADRHACVQVLQDAIARGLLTPAEGGDRMGAAFAAVHRVDLEPLTADLPPRPEGSGSPSIASSLAALGVQLRSALQTGPGRSRAAQLAATVVLLVLLLVIGTAMMHVLLDGGGRPAGGGGFGRH